MALLLRAGRLLLEYNQSTEGIHRALTATARAMTDEPCVVEVSYRGLAVSLAGEAPSLAPVKELRYNAAVQAKVHAILEQVRRGALEPSSALARLGAVESETPRHSRWLAALALSLAAAALAGLLGADAAAAAVAGGAAGLGLLARQELGRLGVSLLALPLTAALIGAVLGGLAIRFGWTRSPELVLIVPALMVVPGPHLINGLFDLVDNHLPMSLARLGLATGILLAGGLGVVLGVEMTLPASGFAESAGGAGRLNLVIDMALAGVVTCGFGVFYNTAWGQLGLAVVGGMAGHGLRFLALEAGWGLEAATFLGGLAVGAISAWVARANRAPVAVIAFAGAVTMIPGLSLYRGLSGAVQLARQPDANDPTTVARTLGSAFQGCLVVAGIALGLILGARLVRALVERGAAPRTECRSGDLV
ncbi:MAG TPA: threonine/serine exporter family protein [Gemmataceae bacterium]|nr:threonine/serine exporter family protein [Gemmataceae bacterium]